MRLARGETGHVRHGRISNAFRYPVFYLKFAVEREAELRALLHRKFPFLSLKSADYLWKKPGTLRDNIRAFLLEHCAYVADDVELLTMPRAFGYGFNPVSFWFCHKDGALDAVLSEVNNTFGERHFYWSKPDAPGAWCESAKDFHVSPFFAVEGRYRFRFVTEPNATRVDIRYLSAAGEPLLTTWVRTADTDLAAQSAWRLVLAYGWSSVMVIARIHFQALRLFLKRATFYKKPELPVKEITQ